ncbi:MAG TPA: S8 family serine peptidase [candidate division Zixibacteria bacterium]|nr:S8 family serine peptidase [candidate division Zixibacteria bacterium]MDD4918358.1 S8 family serine peptidase [candidate division Zixibacteria bacterium]MDM7973306.1 S8 family serine peptidase [candidate division Zixibacteria bacterium]HOD66320.1 S8 family serine peptidase [candidate division Zixibacteria bacterium]HPM38307.1 S8 family serine peptidase [candidate division Zixibacteria bacterium]
MRRLLKILSLIGIVLLTGPRPAMIRADAERPNHTPGDVVCRVLPGSTIEEINQTYGTAVKGHLPVTDVYLLMIPQGQNPDTIAARIDADARVDFCRPNYYLAAPEGFQRSSPFVDAELIGTFEDQPAAVTLDLATAALVSTGAGARIALIDGGVAANHPVFASFPGDLVSRWDYLEEDSVAQADTAGSCAAHGTFVAAVLQLVAPGADVYVYKVLDTAGQGNAYAIAAAILQAIDDGCDVINLSLGMTRVDESLDDALRTARQSGVSVVASAGNDSTNLASLFPFPASRSNVIAVAALDSVNVKADFSNYGVRIDVCCPGTRVYSAYADTLFAWWDGTSFAAPMAAGVIACLRSRHPGLTPERIDTILARSSHNVDSLNPGLEAQLGAGLIDPPAALALAGQITRGDVTLDGRVDINDLTALVNYLFRGATLDVLADADVSCDSAVNIADLTLLVKYLFLGAAMPCGA